MEVVIWVEVATWVEVDIWEEDTNTGKKMPSTTKTITGVKAATTKCLNGKTNTTVTSHPSNSTVVATNVTEQAPCTEEECPSPAETATENEVSALNASEEEPTTSTEDLAGNVKEVDGNVEEDIEVPVVVPVMMTTGEVIKVDMVEEDTVGVIREDLISNKVEEAMVAREVSEEEDSNISSSRADLAMEDREDSEVEAIGDSIPLQILFIDFSL